MPHFLLDNFDTPGLWDSHDPANNPSPEIVVNTDTLTHPFAEDATSLRIEIQAGAVGHLLRRTIAATDISSFNNLTFWYRSDVATTPAIDNRLRLRLALGSGALPIGAIGNEWARYFIAERANSWTYETFALDDLPNAISSALTTIEIQVAAITDAHTIHLDSLEVQAPQMIEDTDSALLARLDAQLILSGNPVPAVIAPDMPLAPVENIIRLVRYETTRNETRAYSGLRRTDFTDTGHRMRPSPIPWDLYYRFEFTSDSRTHQAAMMDFVINRLGHKSWLPIGNRAMRIEQIPQVMPDDALVDSPAIRYRVAAWNERGAAAPVRPTNEVLITTDLTNGGA